MSENNQGDRKGNAVGKHTAKQSTEHTPGPWTYNKQSSTTISRGRSHTYSIDLENGERIALLGTNQEANARLIAAAPELLEALKEVNSASLVGTPYDMDCAVIKARKAIAKAEVN